jgi:hypothetical protein
MCFTGAKTGSADNLGKNMLIKHKSSFDLLFPHLFGRQALPAPGKESKTQSTLPPQT